MEVHITFWKSSGERTPPPSISNSTPDKTIIVDHIFMNILPEMYLGIRKSPSHFGCHLESADPRQRSKHLYEQLHIITIDPIIMQILPVMDLWKI